MDANGTRFHLLLGRDDWARCLDAELIPLSQEWDASPLNSNLSGLAWDRAHAELTLQSRLFRFVSTSDKALPIENRRGAARDRFGNWYWIDVNNFEIRVNSAGTGTTAHFWQAGDGVTCEPDNRFGEFQSSVPSAPPQPLALSGLAITDDHYLVVGTLEPAGILIFDLHAGGSPRQMLWSPDVPFAPFDMTPAPGGGVFILDRTNRCYWALDRRLNVIRLDGTLPHIADDPFQPVDGSATRQASTREFPDAITLDLASPIPARDPIAIEALPDGSVLILDNAASEPYSQIFHFLLGEELGAPLSTDVVLQVVEAEAAANFHLRGYDFCFVENAARDADPALLGRLYVVESAGNQSFAFHVFQRGAQLELEPLAEYLPMRLFGGKALVNAGGQAYYDFADGWIPLVEQKRPRYVPAATLFTPAFDGREPDCVWHRLMLDACIPPDTQVEIWSRTANEQTEIESAAWMPEPSVYLRPNGSELPYVVSPESDERGTWETLFQRAQGQYLQLKLLLSGNGRSTPRLHALRAYYPRFAYRDHYLPGAYRQEPESASFLDRFLANVEGTLTALEDEIAAVQILFDVRSAPAETLDWLANWFGIALDPLWDERRRRLFIKHAMTFFQYRGTVRGVLMALRLALDACVDDSLFENPQNQAAIRIVEKFRTRRMPAVLFGDPTDTTGPRIVAQTLRWSPEQGRDNLNERYRAALGVSGEFPIRDPGGSLSGAWQQFARDTLGFVPVAVNADAARWREFLTRQYANIGALNGAYGKSYASFDEVPLPNSLPPDDAPLKDWFAFEGVVLRMRDTAHRFSILLPAPLHEAASSYEELRRVQFAERIANLEKPAHTVFDVKFYWAVFRIGEARLGLDTLVDRGSRAPELMRPLVVGEGYLSEAYLAPGHPQDITNRYVVGRERF